MRGLVVFAGALVLSACTPRRPAEAPGSKGEPSTGSSEPGAKPDIEAMAAREATGLSEQKVNGPGGMFTAKVPASGAVKVTMDGKVAIAEIPIGSQEPVRCQVFDGEIDPGGTIAQVLGNATAKVKLERTAPWAVEVVKEAPVAFVHSIYTVVQPKGKALGELKVALHAVSNHPVICLHDELGYEKTFVETTKAFCDSIQHRGPAMPSPSYVEVDVLTLKDTPIGFTREAITKEGEDRVSTSWTTTFMPLTATDMRIEDEYSIQHLDGDNRLKSGVWVTAAADKIDLKVTLRQTKPGKYHYEGELQGKKIQGDFGTKDGKPLRGGPSISKEVSEVTKRAGPYAIDFDGYSPSQDPTKPIPNRLFRDKGDAPDAIRLKAGNIAASGLVDDKGLVKTMDLNVGALSLHMNRAFVRGLSWGK